MSVQAKVLELQELLRVQEAAWQQQQQRELDRLERENTEFKQYAQRNQREHENNVSVMRQQQAEFKKQLQQAQKTPDLLQTEQVCLVAVLLGASTKAVFAEDFAGWCLFTVWQKAYGVHAVNCQHAVEDVRQWCTTLGCIRYASKCNTPTIELPQALMYPMHR